MNRHIERDEQTQFFRYVRTQARFRPVLNFCFSTLNGVKLSMQQAIVAKSTGNTRGVPDILFLEPRGEFHGLAIEMKTATGRTSPEQDSFLFHLNDVGYKAVVCRSCREAINVLEDYLQLS